MAGGSSVLQQRNPEMIDILATDFATRREFVKGMQSDFVVLTNNAFLPNERALAGGDGIAIADGGAGSTITLNVDISPQADIGTPASDDVLLVEDITDGSIKKVQASALVSGGGGAPVDAEYVVLAYNGTLTQERLLTGGSGIDITDLGAGSTATLDLGALSGNWDAGGFEIRSGSFYADVSGMTIYQGDLTIITAASGEQGIYFNEDVTADVMRIVYDGVGGGVANRIDIMRGAGLPGGALELLTIEASGDVGINQTSPSARLHVVGSADDQQLIIQANATQTNNIVEWQTSASAFLGGISGIGNFGIGTTTNATRKIALAFDPTETSGAAFGNRSVVTATPGASSSAYFYGISARTVTSDDNAYAFTGGIRGIESSAYHEGDATANEVTSFYGVTGCSHTGASGSITSARSIKVLSQNLSSSGLTIGTYAGVQISQGADTVTQSTGVLLIATTSTSTYKYGIEIGAISGGTGSNRGINIGAITGTSPYAIYTNAGTVYFGDHVGIGVAPTANKILYGKEDQNTVTSFNVLNANSGNASRAGFQAESDTGNAYLYHYSSTYTDTNLQNHGVFGVSSASDGIRILATAAGQIIHIETNDDFTLEGDVIHLQFDSGFDTLIYGDLGVGETDPDAPLHVTAGGTNQPSFAGSTVAIFQNTTDPGGSARVVILADNTGFSIVDFADNDTAGVGRLEYNHNLQVYKLYVESLLVYTVDSSGTLTFDDFPITPSLAPNTNYEVANKKYVDDNVVATVQAQYVTLATHADLTVERVLTGGNGIGLTDAGAGSTVTLDLDALDSNWNAGAFTITSANATFETINLGKASPGTTDHIIDVGGKYVTNTVAFDWYTNHDSGVSSPTTHRFYTILEPGGTNGTWSNLYVASQLNLTAASVNWVHSLFSSVASTSGYTGTWSNAAALYVDQGTYSGSSPTNLYGLYVESQTGGSSTNYAIYTNTGAVLFGDSTSIIGSADEIQLLLKANATQTNNIVEWQKSTGTVYGGIDPIGRMGVGSAPDVNTFVMVSPSGGISTLSGSEGFGINCSPSWAPDDSNRTKPYTGVNADVKAYDINATGTLEGVTGGRFRAQSRNTTQIISSLIGGDFRTYNYSATTYGNVTLSIAGKFSSIMSGGTWTDHYGIYIVEPTGSGTLTNNYGLYVEGVSKGATLNYAIYTNAGLVRFGDMVEIAPDGDDTNATYEIEVARAGAGAYPGIMNRLYSDSAEYPLFGMMKSHNDSIGTLTATIADEILGRYQWNAVAATGPTQRTAAWIQAIQDGASASYNAAHIGFGVGTTAAAPTQVMSIYYDRLKLDLSGSTYGVDFIDTTEDAAYGYVGLMMKPDGIGASTYHETVKLFIEPYNNTATFRAAGIAFRDSGDTVNDQWGGIVANSSAVYFDFGNKSGATHSLFFRAGSGFAQVLEFPQGGGINMSETTAEPSDPGTGECVFWMSNGTGYGDDGDFCIKLNPAGVVKSATIVDFSTL